MNEKVLQLLSLCLQARELGEFIFFEFRAGVNAISIYAYADYSQISRAMAGEICPKKLDYYFYLDGEEEDVLELIANAEADITELIETAKAKNGGVK
jgi:hypothetical protein